MRRVLKAVILDRDPGDITTIEDEGSVDEARQAWQQMKAEIAMSAPFERVPRVRRGTAKVHGRVVQLSRRAERGRGRHQGRVLERELQGRARGDRAPARSCAASRWSAASTWPARSTRAPTRGSRPAIRCSSPATTSASRTTAAMPNTCACRRTGSCRCRQGLTLSDVMAIGTAGFTAALSVVELERNGLAPANGPVIVTGATGGVGSMAVQWLAARGYRVTALTGKDARARLPAIARRRRRAFARDAADGHAAAREGDVGRRRRSGRRRDARVADADDDVRRRDRVLGPDRRDRSCTRRCCRSSCAARSCSASTR